MQIYIFSSTVKFMEKHSIPNASTSTKNKVHDDRLQYIFFYAFPVLIFSRFLCIVYVVECASKYKVLCWRCNELYLVCFLAWMVWGWIFNEIRRKIVVELCEKLKKKIALLFEIFLKSRLILL
jgi:hypothetical protein